MAQWSKRLVVGLLAVLAAYYAGTRLNLDPTRRVGDAVDSLDGVAVYYNGGVNHSGGRNLAADGYNLGIRYQCVEFVKRYYYEHFKHRMPDAYGHAADFFNRTLADGAFNAARGLTQHQNGGASPPAPGDILVFDRWLLNPYGHVAIVSRSDAASVELIQQNPGPFAPSRVELRLNVTEGRYHLDAPRLLGWLRAPKATELPKAD